MKYDATTKTQIHSKGLSLLPARTLAVALAFGLAALAIVEAGITLPIPGTGVVTDPRELFTTLGAGLTGPLSSVVIGVLAGIREPGGIILASLLAHVSGGLWMGFSYKKLVYDRLSMPFMLLGWAGLVLVYYYVFVIPGFVIGQALFYSEAITESYGKGTSLLEAYLTLGGGVRMEAFLTTSVTTLMFAALPRRHRRPMW